MLDVCAVKKYVQVVQGAVTMKLLKNIWRTISVSLKKYKAIRWKNDEEIYNNVVENGGLTLVLTKNR